MTGNPDTTLAPVLPDGVVIIVKEAKIFSSRHIEKFVPFLVDMKGLVVQHNENLYSIIIELILQFFQ